MLRKKVGESVLIPERQIQLFYFLETFKGERQENMYGICVQKVEQKKVLEEESTGGFSYEEDLVRAIIQILMRNQITPVVLQEVVYDFLSERLYS